MDLILVERINVATTSEQARPYLQLTFNVPSFSTNYIRQTFSREVVGFLNKNVDYISMTL